MRRQNIWIIPKLACWLLRDSREWKTCCCLQRCRVNSRDPNLQILDSLDCGPNNWLNLHHKEVYLEISSGQQQTESSKTRLCRNDGRGRSFTASGHISNAFPKSDANNYEHTLMRETVTGEGDCRDQLHPLRPWTWLRAFLEADRRSKWCFYASFWSQMFK